jgi:subtilisin family serine protease
MRTVVVIIFLGFLNFAEAQNAPGYYWVHFADKVGTPYNISYPQAFLSERALQKRADWNIEITEQDLPVNPSYVQAVLDSSGGTLHHVTKWFNAMTVNLTQLDSAQFVVALNKIQNLPFVLEIKSTGQENPRSATLYQKNYIPENVYFEEPSDSPYGKAFRQLDMMEIPRMHESGFQGKDIHVGVFDVGWLDAPSMHAFDALRSEGRLKMTRDFVDPLHPNVYDGADHGTIVLGLMTAELDSGKYKGAAPEANYYLFQTENVSSEYRIEEDNWVAAAELADSLGLDVINSSLGYSTFDDSTMNYTYADMNGHVSRASQAAQWLSERGVMVVCSAGNSGIQPWYYLHAPSDAEKILCIGATDSLGKYAFFSSHGPAADGRLKPNVTAQGYKDYYPVKDDRITRGSGTSFSAPLITGGIACLMQALPHVNNQVLMDWIQSSSSQFDNPNIELGNGIPDFYWVMQQKVERSVLPNLIIHSIYPNPAHGVLNVITRGASVECFRVIDLLGRPITEWKYEQSWTKNYLQLDVTSLPEGVYLLELKTSEGIGTTIFQKITN